MRAAWAASLVRFTRTAARCSSSFDLVRDQAGYTVPVGVAEEIGPLAQRLA